MTTTATDEKSDALPELSGLATFGSWSLRVLALAVGSYALFGLLRHFTGLAVTLRARGGGKATVENLPVTPALVFLGFALLCLLLDQVICNRRIRRATHGRPLRQLLLGGAVLAGLFLLYQPFERYVAYNDYDGYLVHFDRDDLLAQELQKGVSPERKTNLLRDSLRLGKTKLVLALLASGMDVRADLTNPPSSEPGAPKLSALAMACMYSPQPVIAAILQRGAEVNEVSSWDRTCLGAIVEGRERSLHDRGIVETPEAQQELVKLLLAAGADPQVAAPKHDSPLVMAQNSAPHLVELLQHGQK
jgi:hypothetical protein